MTSSQKDMSKVSWRLFFSGLTFTSQWHDLVFSYASWHFERKALSPRGFLPVLSTNTIQTNLWFQLVTTHPTFQHRVYALSHCHACVWLFVFLQHRYIYLYLFTNCHIRVWGRGVVIQHRLLATLLSLTVKILLTGVKVGWKAFSFQTLHSEFAENKKDTTKDSTTVYSLRVHTYF